MRKAYPNELYHHGIKGQKWGVRRYQNPDGTLTEAGKKRYDVGSARDVKPKPQDSDDFIRGTRWYDDKTRSNLTKKQAKKLATSERGRNEIAFERAAAEKEYLSKTKYPKPQHETFSDRRERYKKINSEAKANALDAASKVSIEEAIEAGKSAQAQELWAGIFLSAAALNYVFNRPKN